MQVNEGETRLSEIDKNDAVDDDKSKHFSRVTSKAFLSA